MKLLKREVIKHIRKDTFAIPDSNNVLIKLNDKFYIESQDGKRLTKNLTKISKFTDGIASYECGEEKGIVTSQGKFFIKNKYDKIVVDGAIIRICLKGKWGFMNRDFKVLCAPKFEFLERFVGNYAKFRDEEGQWGIVSIAGRIVVKAKYSFLGALTGEQIAARTYKGYGAINIRGEEVVPFKFEKIASPDGQTALFNLDGEKYVLN